MLSQDELNKIRERAEKATPDKWQVKSQSAYHLEIPGVCRYVEFLRGNPHYASDRKNFEFIAHARTDIPALLEHVAEVEKELNGWRSLMIWGGTPERVDAFIKGQQIRIHECQNIERELEAAESELARQALARKEGA